MTGYKLFSIRLKQEILYQWKVFRTITDWTIIVYILLPFLGFLSYQYFAWWKGAPIWAVYLPKEVFIILFYFFCWQGQIRTFVEEGDQLYLLQKRKLVLGLKYWTKLYSLSIYLISFLILFLFISPILLVHYKINLELLSLFFLFFCSCKVFILLTKQFLQRILSGWTKLFYFFILFSGIGIFMYSFSRFGVQGEPVFLFIGIILLGGLSVFVNYCYNKSASSFLKDVLLDQQEKLKFIKYIFIFSEAVEKESKIQRKEPWLFQNSKRIFKKRTKENHIRELYIKVMLRNPKFIKLYLQMILVTIAVILLLPPIWMKILLYLGFIYILNMWLEGIFDTIINKGYLPILTRDEDIRYGFKSVAVKQFLIPASIITGLPLVIIMINRLLI